MRVFTAVFYFFFFSLTVWGQTRQYDTGKAAGQHICLKSITPTKGHFQVNFASIISPASSLEVSSR